jgi:acyl-CoA thioesterase-1
MQSIRTGLLLMTCLLAVCCSREEKSEARLPDPLPPPAKPAAAPAKEDDRKLIVVFGDSLTEGGFDAGKSYTDYLQHMIDAKQYPFRVVNLGISGDTTTGGVERMQPAIAMNPKIVILELGGNDGLRGLPISTTQANLERMIEAFQKPGVEVVLAGMTLPPNYGREYIQSFEKMYVDVARKHKLTFIPFLLEGIRQQLGKTPGLMNTDGIHPTAKGNEIVASTVMQTLEPMLRR